MASEMSGLDILHSSREGRVEGGGAPSNTKPINLLLSL